jgi:hypothetical protein
MSAFRNRTLLRLGQAALTFVCFAACNLVAVQFQVVEGVSILFPATAVAIVACMAIGGWAAAAVVLATIATPWTHDVTLPELVTSGLVCAAEGMIPYLVFRMRHELTRDLRDMRSLVMFLTFGTIVNTGVSAVLGNLFVVPVFTWRAVFVWWISGFVAALLLALPILAFGGALLNHRSVTPPRTITNALEIVTVILLLGFGASFAIRTHLLDRLEDERLAQQQTWSAAQEKLERMHANFVRATLGDVRLETARQTHADLTADLTPLLMKASPELHRDFPRVTAEAARSASPHPPTRSARGGRFSDCARRWIARMPARGWRTRGRGAGS